MKPNVFQVARKLVELYEGQLTPLKLQKLAYYCQAWFLAWEEVPFFDEDFQAWANGPVNSELYDKHKGTYVIENNFLSEYTGYDFDEKQMHAINSILAFYGNKEPFYLSQLTHQERPWREARGNAPVGAICTDVISKESMRDYYAGISS